MEENENNFDEKVHTTIRLPKRIHDEMLGRNLGITSTIVTLLEGYLFGTKEDLAKSVDELAKEVRRMSKTIKTMQGE